MLYAVVSFLVLLTQSLNANVWIPGFSFYTKARFLDFDIWWIIASMLIEIAIVRPFIKRYSFGRIVGAVLLANGISTLVGFMVPFIESLQLLPAQMVLWMGESLRLYTYSSAVILLLDLSIKLLIGVAINTAIEYWAYFFLLHDVPKMRLFWVTVVSNLFSNIFMVLILLLVPTNQKVLLEGKSQYSWRNFIEKIYQAK